MAVPTKMDDIIQACKCGYSALHGRHPNNRADEPDGPNARTHHKHNFIVLSPCLPAPAHLPVFIHCRAETVGNGFLVEGSNLKLQSRVKK